MTKPVCFCLCRPQRRITSFLSYNYLYPTREAGKFPSNGVSTRFSTKKFSRKTMPGTSSSLSLPNNNLSNFPLLTSHHHRDCPKCKTKRRASKKLSLARLPPILMVHLKRFEANGRISDKIDTFVDFPVKSLDLTNYMPPPLPPGADRSQLNGGLPQSLDDPQTQLPPYRYDLYGVTNHYGHLTSGHCAFFFFFFLAIFSSSFLSS